MKALDVMSLPLQGAHLIEASAGTGKTFTLAHLYLRLIVERDLNVEQILVVTFTRAAVQELRTRLRKIIVDAREVLRNPEGAEGLVADLLQPHLQVPNLAERLEAAQLSMDQASISTIHTFCMQLLSDNAFESGQLFDMQVADRDHELQLLAVQDYWRQHYLQLDNEAADWIYKSISSPDRLLAEIKPLLSANPPRLLPAGDSESYQRSFDDVSQRWSRLRQHWQDSGADIKALIDHSTALNGNKVRSGTVQKAADWLDVSTTDGALPSGFPDHLKVFRDSHLCASVKKGQSAPEHVFFKLIDELWDLLGPLSALRLASELNACASFVEVWLQEQKSKQRLMSYEDLLLYAAQALEGEGSDALAQRLRLQYPAALIDEFQDTDPRQYGIFSTLYADQEDLAWYMIGDPKQAIYSFRGADLNTYLRAASQTENQHTLGTNWRSTAPMVAAVNALFENTARPFAMTSLVESQIQFLPVDAGGVGDEKGLFSPEGEQKALRIALLDNPEAVKPLNKSVASAQAARTTAALISQQLQAAQDGKLHLGDKPLLPAHIAVLVRSNRQGKQINDALSALGIASVVTGNDSIFTTHEATNLRRLLQALGEPASERLVLRVLACDLCGFKDGELLFLQGSDADWQKHSEIFVRLSILLQRQGLLAALLSLMAEYRTASRLRLLKGGERRLSNYLQLGELMQEAWQEQPDLDSLQAWLERHCDNPGAAGEVAQLRLETDEKLVQIVTVHKSKGLEYPLVYLPYAWSARAPKSSDRVKCQTANGHCIDLGSDRLDDHMELMRAEDLAEDVRLLYVALTRASAQCTVLWGDVSQAQRTAMARLLGQTDEKMAIGFAEGLCNWVDGCEQAELLGAVESKRLRNDESKAELKALSCAKPPRPSWQISSYSALVRKASGHAELPDYDAGDAGSKAPTEAPETDLDSIMFFPRGAQAGTFLHYLFEHADFSEPDEKVMQKLVDDSLAAHGYPDIWRKAVLSMMQQVLGAALSPVAGLHLRDLTPEHRLNEMGFHFPVPSLGCDALLRVLREYKVIGPQEFLDFDTVRGYMTGFVDLIFRFDDKYYVLDYKSNHLGYFAEDYHAQALQMAMQDHRYDLQYLMYTVALHRYLATRIPEYSYEEHMGGSFYLFLRGLRIDDESASGIFFDKPPIELIDALDQLFAATQGAPA